MPSFENPFPYPSHEAQEDLNEPVLVDGTLRGLETNRLSLSEFAEAPSFRECFFETESGNIYCVLKDDLDLILADGRVNAGKGSVSTGSLLSEAGVLEVGQPFRFGRGNTSRVIQIVVVTDAAFFGGGHSPDPAASDAVAAAQTGGRQTDIRRRFHKMVSAGQ